jgi:hypothetical protein
MLHALRNELAYFRVWLLGGLGIAAFTVLLLSVIVRFFEDSDGPPFFVMTIFPIIAGMVVSFIAQGQRVEEHRNRLLLAGPLSPRDLAGVTVLLPSCFVALSLVGAIPIFALASLIMSKFEITSLSMTAGFALQSLAIAQIGPLAQESTAARRQGRTVPSLIGWLVFATIILFLAITQFFYHAIEGQVGLILAILVAMGVAATLFQGRTDFTR